MNETADEQGIRFSPVDVVRAELSYNDDLVQLASDAKEDVLEHLFDLFYALKEEAASEAAKADVDKYRLETLVRVTSQAADNYRYHASH